MSSTKTRRANGSAGRAPPSTGLPLVFLNRVGGQDELAFDGSSFIMHPDGEIVVQMADWDEDFLTTEWTRGAGRVALRHPRVATSSIISRATFTGR